MSATDTRTRHTFVVRLWHEPSELAPPGQWRGSVDHLASGDQRHFLTLRDLCDFIVLQTEREGPGPIQIDVHDPSVASAHPAETPTVIDERL